MQSLRVIGVLLLFVCSLHSGWSKDMNTIEEMMDASLEGYRPLEVQQTMDDNGIEKHLVSFLLYTKEHNDTALRLVPGDAETLTSTDFDGREPTKIIIHGWLGDADDFKSVCSILKTEYFETGGHKYNVICVDWSLIALDLPYFTARLRCKAIGNYVAELISMLVDNSAQTVDNMHVIGFSMGAHIAGYAGKQLEGQVQRITGLDPARPLFPSSMPSERLSEDDAKFVDIVHTSSFVLGQHKPMGNIDFYPNGGITKQPGCDGSKYFFGEICSHFKSFAFYARSIRSRDDDEFKAVQCEQWEDYERSRCNDDDNFTYMGEYASSK